MSMDTTHDWLDLYGYSNFDKKNLGSFAFIFLLTNQAKPKSSKSNFYFSKDFCEILFRTRLRQEVIRSRCFEISSQVFPDRSAADKFFGSSRRCRSRKSPSPERIWFLSTVSGRHFCCHRPLTSKFFTLYVIVQY